MKTIKQKLVEIRKLNAKAKRIKHKELVGALYTSSIQDIKNEIKHEFKKGYAHTYKITKVIKPSVNKFKIQFYQKPSNYSFYWARGNQKTLRNSSGETAKQALSSFRKRKTLPKFFDSVDRNMFLTHIRESISIAKPKDKIKLMKKLRKG